MAFIINGSRNENASPDRHNTGRYPNLNWTGYRDWRRSLHFGQIFMEVLARHLHLAGAIVSPPPNGPVRA